MTFTNVDYQGQPRKSIYDPNDFPNVDYQGIISLEHM